VATTFNVRPSTLILDPSPDAVVRFEIDYLVATHWKWLEAKLNETRRTGTGKSAKTVPKYTLEQLLQIERPMR
jgi:hypothetical protein